VNYYEHHLGDYLKRTIKLSMIEDGAYRRLLDHYYIEESPIPAGDVFKAARAQSRHEKEAVRAVLNAFFREESGTWRHDRADEEIARFRKKSAAAQASANARWAKEKSEVDANGESSASTANAHANASGDAMRTHSDGNAPQSPVTSNHKDKDKLSLVCAQPAAEHDDEGGEADLLGHHVNGHRGPPECPHIEVLGLWAEVMPDQVQHDRERWKGKRADHLRARWRETAVAKGWASQAEGIAYMRKFFMWCRRSPFLMGKVPPRPGHRQFELELAWLVNPENWTKTHEGKYHSEG